MGAARRYIDQPNEPTSARAAREFPFVFSFAEPRDAKSRPHPPAELHSHATAAWAWFVFEEKHCGLYRIDLAVKPGEYMATRRRILIEWYSLLIEAFSFRIGWVCRAEGMMSLRDWVLPLLTPAGQNWTIIWWEKCIWREVRRELGDCLIIKDDLDKRRVLLKGGFVGKNNRRECDVSSLGNGLIFCIVFLWCFRGNTCRLERAIRLYACWGNQEERCKPQKFIERRDTPHHKNSYVATICRIRAAAKIVRNAMIHFMVCFSFSAGGRFLQKPNWNWGSKTWLHSGPDDSFQSFDENDVFFHSVVKVTCKPISKNREKLNWSCTSILGFK